MEYESKETKNVKSAIELARKEFKPLKKSGVNAYFKNTKGEPHLFTTLDDIFDSCLEALTAHNLSVTYQTRLLETANGFDNILTTNICDTKSGEYILSASLLGNQNAKMQEVGSAITYMRRYQIQAMLNLEADFEDDGNVASGKSSNTVESTKPSRTYSTFDKDGNKNGTYTIFASYVKSLNIVDLSRFDAWVKVTKVEISNVKVWAEALETKEDKNLIKAKTLMIKKCDELINEIGEQNGQ